MIHQNDITGILINLEVEERTVLFIKLFADGTINRQGDGSADCRDNDLYIGKTDTGIFEALKSSLNQEILEFMEKSYNAKKKEGRACKLQILVDAGGERPVGSQFIYGEYSSGPPASFTDFIVNALELTHPWHVEQKKAQIKARRAGKPWWKFF